MDRIAEILFSELSEEELDLLTPLPKAHTHECDALKDLRLANISSCRLHVELTELGSAVLRLKERQDRLSPSTDLINLR